MGKKGLLLIGHGSRLPFNRSLVEETAKLMAAIDPEYVIRVAFMERDTPNIREALEAFRREEIEMLVAVPLFLAKGVHILKDIPEELGLEDGGKRGTFRIDDREIPLIYADPIGNDPLLAQLMLKNARDAIQRFS
ncbi:MAG: sirohydrochlorin nickelochelatase [Methanomicrobiales archaeon]|nr:sirohydrochlorin nickelochelatase [Methanomicrobiales archaeon]